MDSMLARMKSLAGSLPALDLFAATGRIEQRLDDLRAQQRDPDEYGGDEMRRDLLVEVGAVALKLASDTGLMRRAA